MGELTVKKKEMNAGVSQTEAHQNRYMRFRTVAGILLLFVVIVTSLVLIARLRLRLTTDQIYETNRTRIQTVLNGLDAGGTEKDELYEEYDRLYIAKLKNVQYYYNDFEDVVFDDAFVRAAAEYADIDSAAVIDRDGNLQASWKCDYDFTRRRFAMLRACEGEDGVSEPFSIAYEDGTKRFFGMEVAQDQILVFVQDWTDTEQNIANMTSWEAVLRGMVSVDTVSIAVSLKDYTFLYNPIDDLTGKDALQNGVPIESLGDSYEGRLNFGGDEWCVVGKKWNDAVVFVMTKTRTDLENDTILIIFISMVLIIFVGLLSAYGIIINRDNIKVGKKPSYVSLIKKKTQDGGERHILNFNLTVARKLLPIAVVGVIVVTAMSYYVQSVNGLASIAYESNRAIEEIGNKLKNNWNDAAAINSEYKEMFLGKCLQIAEILEENPQYIYDYDVEAENVHEQPLQKNDSGQVTGGLDDYGNICYSVSQQEFLKEVCEVNAIETMSWFDEYGRIMATNGDNWYYVMQEEEPESQSYPFWEILAEHRDYYTQDLGYDGDGQYSQYIGSACYYYTVQNEDGSTGYVSRSAYQSQLDGDWDGPEIEKHRGMLQINIAPERLRSVAETATLSYVAAHTTIHGTGHTVICDTSEDHLCVYSPRETDIGKPASSMGYSKTAFNETGEMYNGYETVNGTDYFQTFKLVDDYDYYIGTAVPLATVFATRNSLAFTTFFVALVSLLIIFVYTCGFGEREARMYETGEEDEDWRIRNAQDWFTVTMPSGKTRKVLSAASRWDAEYVPWESKTPEQKFSSIVRTVFYIFADFLFICIILSRWGIFNIDAINYVYEGVWTKGFNIFAMTNGVITLIIVFVLANLAEIVIENLCVNIGSRAETLGHLFSSVIHYGVALFSLFYILYLCGLDTGSLIASAGIMSLVIGLGAQSMIQDILAGVFIVFEGAFRVGDIVTIGDFRGNVLEIGLRTTKIEDVSKNIKVFNNSTLSGIINMTKEASFAAVDVSVAYGEPIERVEAVLAEELPKIAERLPAIMDGPFYRGVSGLMDSSVLVKIVAMCKEQDRMQLCRDLNREILIVFTKHGINIPFPQVTVSYLEEPEPASRKEKRQAEKFVEEQKEKMQNVDVEDEGDK